MPSAIPGGNPPIFIVGLPRSGSTLWHNVIGNHPDVAKFTEAHFLSVWHRDFRYFLKHDIGNLADDENVSRLVDAIFSQKHNIEPPNTIWFWNQIRKLEENGLKDKLYNRFISSDRRDIGKIFRVLIEEATLCRVKKRALVKFPVYPAYLDRLIDWWPEGKIIHITRDPRAIAVSKSKDPGGVEQRVKNYSTFIASRLPFAFRYFAVLQYIWASHIHKKYDGHANYRLFRYEDLLSNPDETIHELCDFCELDFNSSMLNPSAGQASSVTGKKSAGFDLSRASGWKKVLSPKESKFIEFITKGSMRRFHYLPDDQY